MKKLFYLPLALLLFYACKNDNSTSNSPKNDVVAANVDTTVSPADDFFMFANGGWIKNHPIPGSESSWSIGKMVNEDIYNKMKIVSENAAKANAAKGSNEQKIGDFWTTGMDSTAIETNGLTAIQPEIDKIASIKDINSFLPLSKIHKKSKKSFVIVTSDFDFNAVSRKLTVVPSILEAHDIIEMDEIERDLGF